MPGSTASGSSRAVNGACAAAAQADNDETPGVIATAKRPASRAKTLGDYAAAAEDLTASLSLRPDHAPSFFNRAIALRRLDQDAEALLDFDAALALEPDRPMTLLHRAATLDALGRDADAEAAYAAALAAAPTLGPLIEAFQLNGGRLPPP